ncbi:hypothetical protein K505DRAFT_339544 [Melanomma pulvis-pyrius CBS 109.77]|uniref:Uncharacterized protein n=1 Tax=Melanomma pulvis-pyrius CBS 109.77 TaxID=1314802 RepID=A0A6A6X5Q5_9PLEO|nr:hypothetical protein K505DRAFT_339544 [Melanomma pulvis-pyrius CBS 109.77]
MTKPSAPTSTEPGKVASASNSKPMSDSKTSTPLSSRPTQLTAHSLPSSNAPSRKQPSSSSRHGHQKGPSPRDGGAKSPSATPSHAGHGRPRVRSSTSTEHQEASYGYHNAQNNVPTDEPLVENPNARAFLDSFRSSGTGYDTRQTPTSRAYESEFGRLERPTEEEDDDEDDKSAPEPAPAKEEASHPSEGAAQHQVDETSGSPLNTASEISAPEDTFVPHDPYRTDAVQVTLHPEPAAMFVTVHLSLVLSFDHPHAASSDEKSVQAMKDAIWEKVKVEMKEMMGPALEKDCKDVMRYYEERY